MPQIGVAKAKKNSAQNPKMRFALIIFGVLFIAILIGLSSMPNPDLILEQEKAQLAANGQTTNPAELAMVNQNDQIPPLALTLIHNRLDTAEGLEAYTKDYSEQVGQPIQIMTISGNADYDQTLIQLDANGQLPDIFLLESPAQMRQWQNQALDLSSESWVQNTQYAYHDDLGRVIGFPTSIEGYGLIYNLDLLMKAGIDPAQLKHFLALQDACKSLNSQKADLGIDSVFAMSVSVENGMGWISSLANFNAYLSNGLQRDNNMVLDQVLRGEFEASRLSQYAQFVELIMANTESNLLQKGNYSDQLQAFAEGKAVFIQDSYRIDLTLESMGAQFDRGFAPLPAFLPETNGVFAQASGWYVVNRESPNQQQALDYLRAMAETVKGHAYLADPAVGVPAFNSLTIEPQNPLAKSLWLWSKSNKTYGIWTNSLPAEWVANQLSPAFEQLAAGTINAEGFTLLLSEAISTLNPIQVTK
ncbi:MAG: extracellular solute-binding protein [Eubacteriales bacterium]|nr:extracellular solute-binding protein [Eubacteriales bacterium]